MSRNITIVAYHRVSDVKNTKFPSIKALQPHMFEEQLERFERMYEFVTLEECLAALDGQSELPENAIMLTFDDGYNDHFHNVFPVLEKKGIQGLFFPSVMPVNDGKVLDVNKIQFIIAAADINLIIQDIFEFIDQNRIKYGFESNQFYISKFCREKWYDSKEVILVKSLLQRELESGVRSLLVDKLFKKFVTSNENSFASELYASIDQLIIMSQNGMIIGGHGYSHDWMDALSKTQQKQEISLTLNFLTQINGHVNNWVFCYPHGGYNKSVIGILQERKCRMAFTIDPGIASITKEMTYSLPRIDTIEFIK